MLKRTILFQSAGYVSLELNRLCFQPKTGEKKMVPIEDLGIILLESLSLTISTALLNALMENNVCVILCDAHHLPYSIMLPMTGNSLSQKVVSAQLSATEAMKKRLWKQTVQAKIRNQASCLEIGKKDNADLLRKLAQKVQNGDPENVEGTAARFYFKSHCSNNTFLRDPAGEMPNPALNYGYAVIRAAVARGLISSGLQTIQGIHHHNQYNAYCLADDIMEPYRPFVDNLIFNSEYSDLFSDSSEVSSAMKRIILSVLTQDVMINGIKRPLMSAISLTSASLAHCYLKEETSVCYPEFCL